MAEMTIEQQRALAMARARGRAAKANASKQEDPGRLMSLAQGFLSGAADVPVAAGEYLVRGLGSLGLVDSKTALQKNAVGTARSRKGMEPYRQAHPNYFTGGEIVGQTVASAPVLSGVGGVISRAAPVVARVSPAAARVIANVGQAAKTGGLGAGRTAAQSAQLSKIARAAQLAQRAAGGSIAGGASAALTNQDIGSGAAFGAGLPAVASVVRRLGGKVVDLTKMPTLKAAQIIREALGKDVDAARAAFAALPDNDKQLAEQVLIKAGIEPDTFFGLGKTVSEQINPTPFRKTLESQAAAREARLAGAAGGATATEQRSATELGRSGVTEATGPARDAALVRANVAGEAVPQAERIATLARQRANEINASGFVPRMRGLEERASEQARLMGDMPAIFPDMEGIQQTRGIAGAAGERANRAMEAQIGLRDTARDMEDIVADLAAEGMQPLRVGPIVGQLRSMAGAPGTRADDLQRGTLTNLANKLEGLANRDGVIDARDLYQIRKTGLNDIVDTLLNGRQPASGTKERTASLLTSARQMIDDAIEGSGGAGWKDYLTRTRQGFETVNRQELAAKGAQLNKENPDELIALMGGERPQMVEDIMGAGTRQYDIGGMALADPRRYQALKQSADELQTLNRMGELRSSGAGAAGNLMVKERPNMLSRGLAALTLSTIPSLRIGAQGAEQVEKSLMSPRVQSQLGNAFLSGEDALTLMNQYPTSLKASEALSKLSPGMRNAIAQLARQYSMGRE